MAKKTTTKAAKSTAKTVAKKASKVVEQIQPVAPEAEDNDMLDNMRNHWVSKLYYYIVMLVGTAAITVSLVVFTRFALINTFFPDLKVPSYQLSSSHYEIENCMYQYDYEGVQVNLAGPVEPDRTQVATEEECKEKVQKESVERFERDFQEAGLVSGLVAFFSSAVMVIHWVIFKKNK